MEGKRQHDIENMDRISNLPMDVIEPVLELLALRDAIWTNILSRNWNT